MTTTTQATTPSPADARIVDQTHELGLMLDQVIARDPSIARKIVLGLSSKSKSNILEALSSVNDSDSESKPNQMVSTQPPQQNRSFDLSHYERIQSTFHAIDSDRSGSISPSEFHSFMTRYHHYHHPLPDSDIALVPLAPNHPENEPPSMWALFQHSLGQGIPFIGFGFIDNSMMIVFGEAIDLKLGATLGISTMASAALGNLLSDIAGVGMGGTIEALTSKLGYGPPNLSRAQLTMTRTRVAGMTGSSLGVTLGCLLGMFPLLFFNSEDDAGKHEAGKAKQTPSSLQKQQ